MIRPGHTTKRTASYQSDRCPTVKKNTAITVIIHQFFEKQGCLRNFYVTNCYIMSGVGDIAEIQRCTSLLKRKLVELIPAWRWVVLLFPGVLIIIFQCIAMIYIISNLNIDNYMLQASIVCDIVALISVVQTGISIDKQYVNFNSTALNTHVWFSANFFI